MKRFYCDKEREVLKSVRSGDWGFELRSHASKCSICADVVTVADFLQHEAELTKADPLPSAGMIWWRAQLASKNRAMAKATQPIQFIQKLACLAGSLSALWFVFESAGGQPWRTEMSKYSIYVHRLWVGDLNQAALLSGAGALVCVCVASLYMVIEEK